MPRSDDFYAEELLVRIINVKENIDFSSEAEETSAKLDILMDAVQFLLERR